MSGRVLGRDDARYVRYPTNKGRTLFNSLNIVGAPRQHACSKRVFSAAGITTAFRMIGA